MSRYESSSHRAVAKRERAKTMKAKKSMAILRFDALTADPKAMLCLSLCYAHNIAIDRNPALALRWSQEASSLSHESMGTLLLQAISMVVDVEAMLRQVA